MATLSERIAESISKHPEWQDYRIAKSFGCGVAAVREVRTGRKTDSVPTRGKSLDQFRQQYDIPLRIRQGIAKHLAGSTYMTDQEFREACSIGTSEWRRHADESEFDPCRVRVRGQVLWAQPKTIEKMREIAGIIN